MLAQYLHRGRLMYLVTYARGCGSEKAPSGAPSSSNIMLKPVCFTRWGASLAGGRKFWRRAAGLSLAVTMAYVGSGNPTSGHPVWGAVERGVDLSRAADYAGYAKLSAQVGAERAGEVIRMIEVSSRPELVRALIEVESGWKVRARSAFDARGLMQIRPVAAREVAPEISAERLWDPVVNVALGITILEQHLDYFQDRERPVEWALTSYNKGRAAALDRRLGGPNSRYARRVLELLEQM